MMAPDYAELQVTTNFSFLRGASHAHEFVARAVELGHTAIAVADRNSLAGIVRMHIAAKDADLPLLVGARLDLTDGASLLAFPEDRAAYGRLSRLITVGRRRAPKGECELTRADVFEHGAGMVFVALPPEGLEEPDDGFTAELSALAAAFPGACYLAGQNLLRGDDAPRLARLAEISEACGVPLVATNDVHMHEAARRPLADVLICIREHCTIDDAGYRLVANGERHLKSAEDMLRLFAAYPDAVARTQEIVQRCRFNLDELRYEYPDEVTGDGRTPQEELIHQTWEGAKGRYPGGVPKAVKAVVEHELDLIGQLGYAPYFLTVYDIVRFARERHILCQGRGSAANSAVCYCLGITAVDPSKLDLLFERFVSTERNEPPDIDVDFEHERREEVIQYIYEKYGRDRAGMTAVVSCYRARGAVREVGKAMGLSRDTVTALAGQVWGWSSDGIDEDQVQEIGLDPTDRRLRQALLLTATLIGFPRHLSQHVGGFVISRGPLTETVPIENAAMEDRTVIEWDKDDLDALGILKIDVLSLGMLTCIRKGFDLIHRHFGKDYDLATVPTEDPAVYDMLCDADSIGVFQVESRAQMAFLPRMKPRDFYDLVIEVAIVRPGPIQGDMVHPYLRRRNGEEQVAYPSEALREVLGKTLGVPLFQEQAMKIAIVGAGFTPSEADRLRRAMATFRRVGTIHSFREKFVAGMAARGYDIDFADRCFRQIEGFGEYGFPESHAASFAMLVYVSAWMKCHYPAVFAAALLNSQPMGFYAPAQIVRDAVDHDVTALPPDVNQSGWDSTLEVNADSIGGLALRLGLRQIKGLSEEHALCLIEKRNNGYWDPAALWRRTGLPASVLEAMARADAFGSMGLKRRQALWIAKGLGDSPLPLFAGIEGSERGDEPMVDLPEMSIGEEVVEDYSWMRLSLKRHPLDLLRGRMTLMGAIPAARLVETKDEARVTVAGLVLVRQRPGSAKGVIFITIEDETGVANIIVWRKTFERFRRVVMTARLLRVSGKLQREGIVTHIVADCLEDLSGQLDDLADKEAFDLTVSPADEVKRDIPVDPRERALRRQKPKPPTPIPRPKHPREQAKALFPSRDFH
jgi:error-prone DNA polymerase